MYQIKICYDNNMSRKSLVILGMIIGSLIGGYIPVIFGAGLLSYSSVLGNGLGGIIGVLIAYKLTEGF